MFAEATLPLLGFRVHLLHICIRLSAWENPLCKSRGVLYLRLKFIVKSKN